MADSIKQLKQNVDVVLNPNKGPGEILVVDHNALLKDILDKLGRTTGFPFNSGGGASVVSGGLTWNGNAMNETSEFIITFHGITEDGNDFGVILSNSVQGDILHFKDYIGHSAFLVYKSHTKTQNASLEDVYNVTVQGFASNPSYIYGSAESEDSFIEIIRQPNGSHYTVSNPQVFKKPSNTNISTLEVGDFVRTFIDDNTLIEGFYLGGDLNLRASFDIVNEIKAS